MSNGHGVEDISEGLTKLRKCLEDHKIMPEGSTGFGVLHYAIEAITELSLQIHRLEPMVVSYDRRCFEPTPDELHREHVSHLKSLTARSYHKTKHWQITRLATLERGNHECQQCQNTSGLHVHHLTYERIGEELPSDLQVLCASCHSKIHASMSSLQNVIQVPND